MGQSEVISLLKESKDWITAEEISKRLNSNARVVRRALLVLIKFNEVSRKRYKKRVHFTYIYKLK